MSESVYNSKYMLKDVDIELIDPLKRIDSVITKYFPHLKGKAIEYGSKKWVGFAGGIYRSAMNPNQNVSAINCTTLYSPEDNLESIADAWYWWAKFAAYGQGEGIDVSNLRPNGAKVHNSSNASTGPISFMKTFDGILKEIAQQGRRGASLISLDVKHPDIPDFITCKDEEGILETANLSIKVSDDFMKSVEEDREWEFKYENKYETISKKIKAKELFNTIAQHAHKTGDPGLLFWDTSVRYSNSDYLGEPVCNCNACSEQVLDGHSTCILSSINLAKFNEYGFEKYKELIEFLTFALDAFRRQEIDELRSPSEEQIRKMKEMPRIGIGVTGFADYLIRKGIGYGSDESIEEVRLLLGTLSGESYKASYKIAKDFDKKSFIKYDKEKYKQSPFIKTLLEEKWIEDYHLDYQAHVCKTTIAPTGSLSMVVESGGSGIEPLFAKYYVRRERSTTNDWKEWFNFNDLVIQYCEENNIKLTKENVDSFDPKVWVTAHSVDNMSKIRLMKIAQKYIDSAISVTYNLKKDASVKEVEDIYLNAWKNELKGVTVYREGSKVGVLITEDNYNDSKKEEPIVMENGVFKRPTDLPCDIHKLKYKSEIYILLVGLYNQHPYEIFVTKDNENEFDFEKHKDGIIRKNGKGKYSLYITNGEEKKCISDIAGEFDSIYGTLGRFISMSLRHNVPLQFVIEQLNKDKNFLGFERTVSRVLKKYIKNGEKLKTSKTCDNCGGHNFVFSEGCEVCQDCGSSKCS